ncbi:unnamed protein product [Acidithrix sp. C25]|nr:unnamed protein product [Acidithrix sp. C25]
MGMWSFLDSKRDFRDAMKKADVYPQDVNVHLVDQAAFDAVDTWVRHIESVLAIENVKAKIHKHYRDNEMQQHFAYTCLTRYAWIGEITQGRVPAINLKVLVGLGGKERAQVVRYLHRVLRKALSKHKNPRAHAMRSMALAETLYATFTTMAIPKNHTCNPEDRRCRQPHLSQYVKIIGAKTNARIALSLVGVSRVSGDIRLVAEKGSKCATVHVVYGIKAPEKATGPIDAIDWGVTEVCTDSKGHKHGISLGEILEEFSEKNNATGKVRGKAHARTRSLRKVNTKSKKAPRIARNNLGHKKQARRRERAQASVRTLSGQATKEVIYGKGNRTRARGKVPQDPTQRPRLLATEDLSYLRGKAKSKKMSRICSTWMRSENEGRMVVHTSIGGVDAKTVNAAYTSQTCPEPTWGYVSSDNRQGDTFHWRNPYWDCNWQGDADHVAATNLKSRLTDRQISVFTAYTEVKVIQNERFRSRKESRVGARIVLQGITGNGVQGACIEDRATAHGRTPSKPRRRKPVVEGGNVFDATDSHSPEHTV